MSVFLLSDKIEFPPPALATRDGLLAVGGDLSTERLVLAYKMGIFPWYADREPVLWWSPDPRLVLFPDELKVARRLERTIGQGRFHVTVDRDFSGVIEACAAIPRKGSQGTWIVAEMVDAYCALHEAGYAHSVEAWYRGELAGGLYGVSLGRAFFGESMFTRVANASKVAFVKFVRYLAAKGFQMIDCQMKTQHLVRFGAREISRARFLKKLAEALRTPVAPGKWRFYSSFEKMPQRHEDTKKGRSKGKY